MAIVRMGAQDEASEIKYDNTSSGLSSVTVQGAIDELDSTIDGLSVGGTVASLTVDRSAVPATNATLSWDEADDSFKISTDGTNYYKIWHAGNDGFGSGLDADTVGGISSTNILQTNANFGGDISGTYNAIVVADDSHNHTNSIGNFTVGDSLNVTNDVVIGGDLTVNGTSFTINTSTIELEGSYVIVNSGETGAPTQNGGLKVERGTSADVVVHWDETNDVWQLTEDGTNYETIIHTGNSTTTNGDIGWKDLTAELTVRGNNASAPVWEQLGATPFFGYNFAIGKECWAMFHVNHDYKPGGDMLIHIHWTSNGTDTAPVRWQIDYSVAKGHNQSAGGEFFSPTHTVYVEEACSGTAWRHMVTEMTSSIELTNVEPDSIIMVHLMRVTNGGTENVDDVYGLTADLHYQVDRRATVNKAPNFYGA